MTLEQTERRQGRPRSRQADAAILSATIDELTERGFIGLSFEAIAARAGVAKTTVYRRWSNTADLAIEAMRGLEESVGEVPDAPAREQLAHLLEVMRRRWADPRYAALMRRVAADGSQQPDTYHECRDRLIGPYLRMMAAALERGVDEGLIRPDVDLYLVRQLLTAPIIAVAFTHKERLTKTQVEFILDTVLRGIVPLAG